LITEAAPRQSVYLDTSVLSAYFDDRTPERMQETQEFWKQLGSFRVCISKLVLEEVSQVSDP
jgi:predicted nucleic acid-binding protein